MRRGILLLALCPCAFALNPALEVAQYAHTSWKIRVGFPKGTVNAIAQTPDGYPWSGTEFGLVRFDAVKPVDWQPPQGQALRSNFVRDLRVTRDGTLWISTIRGVASWKNHRLTRYPELDGTVGSALLEDREGTVWIEVAIRYDPRRFTMRVRDNGKGIDPQVLDRASLAGGSLAVRSRPGSGTEIELTIPAAMAYRKLTASGRGAT